MASRNSTSMMKPTKNTDAHRKLTIFYIFFLKYFKANCETFIYLFFHFKPQTIELSHWLQYFQAAGRKKLYFCCFVELEENDGLICSIY